MFGVASNACLSEVSNQWNLSSGCSDPGGVGAAVLGAWRDRYPGALGVLWSPESKSGNTVVVAVLMDGAWARSWSWTSRRVSKQAMHVTSVILRHQLAIRHPGVEGRINLLHPNQEHSSSRKTLDILCGTISCHITTLMDSTMSIGETDHMHGTIKCPVSGSQRERVSVCARLVFIGTAALCTMALCNNVYSLQPCIE